MAVPARRGVFRSVARAAALSSICGDGLCETRICRPLAETRSRSDGRGNCPQFPDSAAGALGWLNGVCGTNCKPHDCNPDILFAKAPPLQTPQEWGTRKIKISGDGRNREAGETPALRI